MEERNRSNANSGDRTSMTASHFQNICQNLINQLKKSPAGLRLFEKNETKKQCRLRPSMVDRDIARSHPKPSVVSSTPMPFICQKNFLSNTSDSVSPISVVKPAKATKPAKASKSTHSRTKLFDEETSKPNTVSSCNEDTESLSHFECSAKGQRLENLVLSLHRSNENIAASFRTEPSVKNQRVDKNASTLYRKNENIFETTDKMVQTSNNSLQGAKKLARNRRSNCDLSFSRDEQVDLEEIAADKRLSDLIDRLEEIFLKRPPVETRIEENLPKIDTGLPWRATIVPHESIPLNANSWLAPGSSDEESFDDTFLPRKRPKTKVFTNKKKLRKSWGRILNNTKSKSKKSPTQSKSELDERSMASSDVSETTQPAEKTDRERKKNRIQGKEKELPETLTKETEENTEIKSKKKQDRSPSKKQMKQDTENRSTNRKNNVLDANNLEEVTSNVEFTECSFNQTNKKVENTRKGQKKQDRAESPIKKLMRKDINDSKIMGKSGKQNMTQDDGQIVSCTTSTDNWRNDLFAESPMKEMERSENGNKSVQSLKNEKKKQNNIAASSSKKQKHFVKSHADKNKEHNDTTDDSGPGETEKVSLKAVVHANTTQKNSKKQTQTHNQQLKIVDNMNSLELGLEVMSQSDEETSREVETFFNSNNQDINFGAPDLDSMEQLRTNTKKTSLTSSVNKTTGKRTLGKTQNKKGKEEAQRSTTKSKAQSTTGIIETTADETTGCLQRRSGRQRKQAKIMSAGYITCTKSDSYYKVATTVKDITQLRTECAVRLSGLQKRRTHVNQMPPIMESGDEMEGDTQKSIRKAKKPTKKQSSKKIKKDERPKRQKPKTVSESRDETNVTRSERVGENIVTSDYVSGTTENIAQNTGTPFARLEEAISGNFGSEDFHNTVFSSPSLQAQGSIMKNHVTSGRISKRSSTKTSEKKFRDSLKKVAENQRDQSGRFIICPVTNELIKYNFKYPVFKPIVNLPGVTFAVTEGINTGWLKISGGMSKPLFKTKNHTMSFAVIEGKAEVGIQDKCDLYKKHEIFIVPQGAEYYINNKNKTKPLLLVFTKYVDKPT